MFRRLVGQSGRRPAAAHKIIGWLAAAAAFALLVWIQASRERVPGSVLLGTFASAIASAGVLLGVGALTPSPPSVNAVPIAWLWRPFASCAAASLALLLSLRAAVAGSLPAPQASAALLVTASSLALIVSGYALFRKAGAFESDARPLWRREGFWLLALGALLYLPLLGSYSLIDPWETHYGEVAREMIERDDWISLWWAQEGFFWSKPALDFWLQGLSFLLLGVHTAPDQMLAAAANGAAPWPEWAARFPGVVLTLVANYLVYRAVRGAAGRRAGFFAGAILLTAPYWFLLAHQSMTDMPYVAPLTAALCSFLLGIQADPEQPTSTIALGTSGTSYQLSAAHGVLGLITMSSLPQLSYLLSRHFTGLAAPARFGLHLDRVVAGSGGGNCGLPGNEACRVFAPFNEAFQPGVAALVWGLALGAFLFVNRREQRHARVCYLAAWYWAALSVLAKGAPGLVLAVLIPVVALCALRRFQDLARLELVSFALLLGAIALPWYVQAFMRHGPPFTDRLLFYDMYKRAFVHVHDTNADDDVSFRYYVWQLGYGLFPWTALCAFGWFASFAGERDARRPRAELALFLGLWFLLAFSLFSVSLTKFHHYILPAVPPLAMLCGVLLDDWLPAPLAPSLHALWLLAAGSALSALFACAGALQLLTGNLWGAPNHEPLALGPALVGISLLGLALAAAIGAYRAATPVTKPSSLQGFACLAAAGCALLLGRDLAFDAALEGPSRLLQLFSYNYARPWPQNLDFRPVLAAFAITAAMFLALGSIPRVRGVVLCAFCALAVWFSAFALDVYMVRIAPHWGQRETILQYYLTRAGPEEPLVAYQLNWKGENFYTGNRLPAFVTSGQPFKNWIAEQKRGGTRVLYVTTEHLRQNVLKSELGTVKRFQVLTSTALNNKFFLARVEL